MKRQFESAFLFTPDSLHILVRPPCTVSLQIATPLLVFAPPVVELVTDCLECEVPFVLVVELTRRTLGICELVQQRWMA